ncbi:cation diffusion facilitator family transporter [Williamsia deligens]|uniref:Cation diffusion facilitator family transporter n=1 Tax=Williamsia deligens TaxID=321325 RepID=A0ABW3G5E2_9NOCA|nr:cation diffusion facilitator family transporter [Williamsia deligens]MCP2194411.1 cation diffusion facilitator family transporter [Williamsia deligens]
MTAPGRHQHGAHGDHDHHHDHDHPATGWRRWVPHALTPHSHDAADRIDDAIEGSARGIRAVGVSFAVLLATAVVQLVITLLSGSVALMADTIHNFSDAFTAVPLALAFLVGRRRPTRRYTYGFGRAEDLAGLFVILMIAASAVVAGYESVRRLVDPVAPTHLAWVAGAGAVGFVGNELVAQYRIRVGRSIGSAALVADGQHARTDGFTSLAVLIGAGGTALGAPVVDPIVGIVITVAIVGVLWTAGRDVLRRLMDAVDPAVVGEAERVVGDVPGVLGVTGVRMRWIGHRMHAEIEVDVDETAPLREAHATAHRAERELVDHVPGVASALVHAYPGHR